LLNFLINIVLMSLQRKRWEELINKYRESNKRLRDENIRISEERQMPELEDDQKKGTDLNLTASQIRKKLRGKNGKKQNR